MSATDARPRGRTFLAPLDMLDAHPGNVREDVGDLTELAASIRSLGVLQPLTATPAPGGRLRLLAGHRRAKAATLAGLTHVPVLVREDLSEDDVVVAMLVENVQRANLTAIEEANALQSLRNRGHRQQDLARMTGKSIAWVSNRIALLELPDQDLEQIAAGEIGIADAEERVRAERRKRRGKQPGQRQDRGWDAAGWHFDKDHPLAANAREQCDSEEHNGRRRLRGIACGICWEHVIRQDAVGERLPVVDGRVDPVAVDRASRGDLTVRLTIAERRAAVALLNGLGLSDQVIAARLGITPRTAMRIRYHQLGLSAAVGFDGEVVNR